MIRFVILAIVGLALSAPPLSARTSCDPNPYFDEMAPERTALDNAQKMLLLFSYTKLSNNSEIFCTASKKVYETALSYLEAAIKLNSILKVGGQVIQRDLQAAAAVLRTTITLEQFADELLLYHVATTPNSVSLFYGEPVDRQKLFSTDESHVLRARQWVLAKNDVVPLVFYATMHAPGRAGVPTPNHLADKLAAQLNGRVPSLLRPLVRDLIRDALVAGFREAGKTLSAQRVLEFGFLVDNRWLNAQGDTVDLPPRDIASIYIGDPRVVGIIQVTSDKIAVSQKLLSGNDLQWEVRAKEAGPAHLVGIFQDDFTRLGFEGSKSTMPMTFQIYDKPVATVPAERSAVGAVAHRPFVIDLGLPRPSGQQQSKQPSPGGLPGVKICTVEMSQTDPDCIPH